MNCPACGFTNLDSQQRCVRCGAFLNPAAAEIPAGPPRARSKRRFRHHWYRWRRGWGFRWRTAKSAPDDSKQSFLVVSYQEFRDAAMLPLVLLPGLPQMLLHRNIRGGIFAGIGIVGLVGIAVLPGTTWWLWGFALLAVAQVNSLCDLLPFGQYPLFRRLGYSAAISFFAFMSLYWIYTSRAEQLLDRQGIRIPLFYENGELQGSDIVEVEAQTEYAAGELVIANSLNFAERDGNGHYYMLYGTLIADRILARGPATVRIKDNAIYLDGSETPLARQPLNPQWHWRNQELKLGPDDYLFIPSWFEARQAVEPILHAADIGSRIVRIRWPWWRRTEFR